LFRRAPGYICTELLHDASRRDRYVTIDHWESQEHWERFRTDFAGEFEALDAKCTGWTISETGLGRFEAV
jgi:heme-degrading monooxygenase HmoA